MNFRLVQWIESLYKFDGTGWKGDVKEYLLDCSKLKAIGRRAENNSKNAVTRNVKEI